MKNRYYILKEQYPDYIPIKYPENIHSNENIFFISVNANNVFITYPYNLLVARYYGDNLIHISVDTFKKALMMNSITPFNDRGVLEKFILDMEI